MLGLVGESGSGKTTTGRSLLPLIEPTSGSIRFDGEDVLKLEGAALRRFRRRAQIVFQDPFSSLNPRMTAARVIAEPMYVQDLGWIVPGDSVVGLITGSGLRKPGVLSHLEPHYAATIDEVELERIVRE